jgi:hypothetical protein
VTQGSASWDRARRNASGRPGCCRCCCRAGRVRTAGLPLVGAEHESGRSVSRLARVGAPSRSDAEGGLDGGRPPSTMAAPWGWPRWVTRLDDARSAGVARRPVLVRPRRHRARALPCARRARGAVQAEARPSAPAGRRPAFKDRTESAHRTLDACHSRGGAGLARSFATGGMWVHVAEVVVVGGACPRGLRSTARCGPFARMAMVNRARADVGGESVRPWRWSGEPGSWPRGDEHPPWPKCQVDLRPSPGR